MLSLLYGPILTSVHDYWKKHIALTIQNFVSKVLFLLFNTMSRFVIAFFPKEQASLNFMAADTISSDFGAQENEVCHKYRYMGEFIDSISVYYYPK